MPVKHSPVKPRTPQGQLVDVEGGETEAEMETITSVNAEMLQRELQNIPQLTFRGEFQSPPTQALGATAGNGNGATAGNGNENGAAGGNGNGSGKVTNAGNGNGNQTGTIQKSTMSRGETEALQRERMAQEEKEKERIELEKREEEARKNQQRKEQDDIRWKEAMEEKKRRQREADIIYERTERNRIEYEERERRRHEAEEAENRAREEEFQKRLKPVSPFVAITQTVPGGILKTPRTNASTPRDNFVLRSNVATPSSTGYTTPSRPASAVEPSSYFKPPVRGATAPPPPVVSKEREVGSKEWIQNFELGRASTPIRRPIAMLATTPVSNTPFGRTANFSMEGYDETPAMKNPYVGGLTSERDLKEYLARKRFDELKREEEVEERAREMLEESRVLKRRKLEEENRIRLAEEEENLRKLNEELRRKQAEDSETDNTVHIRRVEKVKKGVDRRTFIHQRRQRRKSGEQVESTTSEESLTAPIGKLTKVLSRVNKRNPDPREREENDQLIGDITDRSVRDAFRKSLQPDEEAIEQRLTSILSQYLGDVEKKINDRIDDEILYRVGRIEDNERLSTRAAVEKKDTTYNKKTQ